MVDPSIGVVIELLGEWAETDRVPVACDCELPAELGDPVELGILGVFELGADVIWELGSTVTDAEALGIDEAAGTPAVLDTPGNESNMVIKGPQNGAPDGQFCPAEGGPKFIVGVLGAGPLGGPGSSTPPFCGSGIPGNDPREFVGNGTGSTPGGRDAV